MVLQDGRFGPYVTDGETNASLRKGDTVEGITVERASELLAERRSKGPATSRRGAGRTKKAAAEEVAGEEEGGRQEDGGEEDGAAKKTAAKKTAARTTAAEQAGPAGSTTPAGSAAPETSPG